MRSAPGLRRRLVTAALLGSAGAALGLGFAERRVLAEGGERITLRWSAPEGCPGERVRAEVDRLLGPSGARPPRPILAAATVSGDERTGFRVHLETTTGGPTRVRELKGASCAALADATALILALMIDPSAVSSERDAGPPADAQPLPGATVPAPSSSTPLAPDAALPAPSPSTLPAPVPTPPSAPTPAPALPRLPATPPAAKRPVSAPPPRIGAGLLAMGALDVGTLPGVSPGVLLGVSLLYGPLRAELGAALWPAHDATLEARPSAGGAVDLFAGTGAACWTLLARRVELGPCLGLEIGRLRAQGFGVTNPSQGSALWAAGRLGGALAWSPVAPLFLGLRLELAVPFSRPGFVLSNVGTVHRPSPAAGRALGGVEVRF